MNLHRASEREEGGERERAVGKSEWAVLYSIGLLGIEKVVGSVRTYITAKRF